jgi:rod shape-determining protein MreC
MRFWKSKGLLLCACAAVVLTVFPTVLALMGIRDPLRGLVRTVTTPFRWCAAVVGDAAEGFADYFREYDRLAEENEQLREQLADYEDALALKEAYADENAWLKQFFGMQRSEYVHRMESARVLDCTLTGSSASLTLSRGSLNGVKVGMPVAVLEGVLGYVREVGPNWCTVSILTSPGNAAGVYVQRSQAAGLAEGTLSAFPNGTLELTMNQPAADVQVGDRVCTAGGGSVYPEGLFVGTVLEVTVDDFSKRTVAQLAPAVALEELSSLTSVMILTETTLRADEAESESGSDASASEVAP